jgi:hypothetical protein
VKPSGTGLTETVKVGPLGSGLRAGGICPHALGMIDEERNMKIARIEISLAQLDLADTNDDILLILTARNVPEAVFFSINSIVPSPVQPQVYSSENLWFTMKNFHPFQLVSLII